MRRNSEVASVVLVAVFKFQFKMAQFLDRDQKQTDFNSRTFALTPVVGRSKRLWRIV